VLLVAVAVTLALETKSLLLGESASAEAVSRIEAALMNTPGVTRVIHMKTLHLGPEEVLVAAKIAVNAAETAAEVASIIDEAEMKIRSAEPVVTALYLEPDIYHADYVPAERPERPAAPSH
jgi:divalent metal cation (Fe/Co/Zn/Cd) transporter